MRTLIGRVNLLFACPLVLGCAVGCGGGPAVSTSPTTPTQPSQPIQTAPVSGSEFLYSFRDEKVLAASLNPESGELSQLSDVTPASISMIVYAPPIASPSGKLYAPAYDYSDASSSSATVFSFSITGSKGQLSAHNNYTPLSQWSEFDGFVMDGSGRFLHTSSSYGSTHAIQSLIIDSSSGTVRASSSFEEPSPLATLQVEAADPGGRFLYAFATYLGGIEIFVYANDLATGAVSNVPNSPFPAVAISSSSSDTFGYIQLLVSPSGKYLYLYYLGYPDFMGPPSHNLYIYAIDQATGGLTETSASPFVVPSADQLPMKFSPSGNLLYIPQRFWDNTTGIVTTDIAIFKVDQGDGSIAPDATSTVPAGKFFLDPSGKVLLVGPGGTNSETFWSYLVNDSSGTVTAAKGSPFLVSDADASWDLFTIARVP